MCIKLFWNPHASQQMDDGQPTVVETGLVSWDLVYYYVTYFRLEKTFLNGRLHYGLQSYSLKYLTC